jgi:hypothetical protein
MPLSAAELQHWAHEVTFQLDESKRQVTYLKHLLKHKVASLKLVVDQHKATNDTLVAEKQTVELALNEITASAFVATSLERSRR